MNDMNIAQAEGSRNYSLHWRDGHVVGGHPTVWGWMIGNHSTTPLPDTRKMVMLSRFVALSVSLTRTASPLQRTSTGASTFRARSAPPHTPAGPPRARARPTAPGSRSARRVARPRALGPTAAASPTGPLRPMAPAISLPRLRTRQTPRSRGSSTGASTRTARTSCHRAGSTDEKVAEGDKGRYVYL